ncbi:hypothetical protein EYR40_004262 [Pleurotus pulmonarius]|nr:hypothetical protein EYR40_004262 [Pleurotus pulmonarius]
MPSPSNSALFSAFAPTTGAALVVLKLRKYGRREHGLPPGPPTTPILGNVPQFPREFPFLQFSEWAAEYGDIYSLKVLDQTMIILSSGRAIKDVLDKNGLSTSDRFQPYTVLHAEGIYQIFDNASTNRWKAMRKATHTFLAPEALQSYWVIQQTEYLRLLHDVLESPKDIYTHIKRTTASVMTTEHFVDLCLCLGLDIWVARHRQDERVKERSGGLGACIKEDPALKSNIRPIVPTGVPDVASRDTQCNGFVIPQGSIIFMNTWGVFHDPGESRLRLIIINEPERYLLSEFGTKPGADTEGLRDSLPFGAGRRICPGAEMAARNIAMNIINLLWAFNFSKDASAACTMDLENYLPGVEFALKPFTCNVEVRSEARASLIRRAYDAAAFSFSTMPSALVGILVATTVFIAFRLRNYGRREQGLPPGPTTTPILGNVLQFPREFPFLQFSQWAAEYGEIYSLKVLDQTMVILSSARAIKDVLDKNGLSTSDRFMPYTILHTEGIYQIFDNASTHRWRAMRKATHTLLAPDALRSYWVVQQTEYLRLLHDVLESPKDIYTHVKRTTASVMATLVYGKSIPRFAGTKAELFFEGTKCISELAAPFDQPPLDFFPILRHVPERYAPWKSLSKKAKQIRNAFDEDLFLQCEEAVRSGKRTGCSLESVIESQTELGLSRDEVRAMGRVLLDAGTETSASFLHSFVMAMVCYPEIQLKAQAEIDQVLGSDQLPVLEDYSNLPYLNALIKEASKPTNPSYTISGNTTMQLHRFRPIIPSGLPHVASRDTQYSSFVIPRGSIIFMNIWGIYHDPELFDDPESFIPERYLLSEFGTKPGAQTEGLRDNLHFGAGRRICPGAEMASRNIAMNAINLLWAFNFSKDQSGTCSMRLENYLPGLEFALKPFTCNMEVRSEARASLIRRAYGAAPTL